ncbi:DUF2474 domain-containing protein [uncultured Jannaschia sp.]|nr:DUF2474 domain-containing protein [uncultured Jannaschia sp.]
MKATTDESPLVQRLLWFGGLWAGGVLSVTLVGAVIRWWLLGT